MKKTTLYLLVTSLFVITPSAFPDTTALHATAQVAAFNKPAGLKADQKMYVIERELPGAGSLTQDELRSISQKSCQVLDALGPQIQWLHSYVTSDKIYCVYLSPNLELVRKHALEGGFPANSISEVKTIIDPATAN